MSPTTVRGRTLLTLGWGRPLKVNNEPRKLMRDDVLVALYHLAMIVFAVFACFYIVHVWN